MAVVKQKMIALAQVGSLENLEEEHIPHLHCTCKGSGVDMDLVGEVNGDVSPSSSISVMRLFSSSDFFLHTFFVASSSWNSPGTFFYTLCTTDCRYPLTFK